MLRLGRQQSQLTTFCSHARQEARQISNKMDSKRSRRLRVLIVGAGGCGLTAIKCCLDEGLEPVCLEQTADLAGMWNYENCLKERDTGIASVMRSTIINTSKEMMCYSDFPIPADFPNYMHNTKLLQYFRMYADNFNLRQYIHFNTKLIRASLVEDDVDSTGRWKAVIYSRTTNEERTEAFDAVLVCSGHHASPNWPHFEGDETFRGTKTHTHDFHDARPYDGKRVVVIGLGNSGTDVAIELSKVCSQVYLSTRRGAWIMNRVGDNGLPTDVSFSTRLGLSRVFPKWLLNWLIIRKINARFDHEMYGLRPDHDFFSQQANISDELPNAIIAGTVIVKPNVRRLTETGVEFDDGTVADGIDAVVFATGYVFGFPSIDHPALEVRNNEVKLYKYVFPPDVQPPSIAVIGCVQPTGAIITTSEMQCRWATRVFKGAVKLPSADAMWVNIRLKKDAMAKRYVKSLRHTIQVDYTSYMDELAREAGLMPNIPKLFLKDPRLALAMMFGPLTSYHYRVEGPGAWPGARQAILTVFDRVRAGFGPGRLGKESGRNSVNGGSRSAFFGLVMIIAVIFVALLVLRM